MLFGEYTLADEWLILRSELVFIGEMFCVVEGTFDNTYGDAPL